jgi:alanine racemase
MAQKPKQIDLVHASDIAGRPTGIAGPSAELAGALLTIDLGAIRANYRRLRAELAGVECAAVVKANGYGLGAAEVARALRQEGCKTFFVAHAAEGAALRNVVGPLPDVFVLNGIPPGAELQAAQSRVAAVINSLEQLEAWRGSARRLGRKLPAAIQIDSGMARIGMAPGEVASLKDEPGAFDGLDVRVVMSHLACADEPSHPANEMQRHRFLQLSAGLPDARRSLANASGIFLGPGYHFDLARPGAALYGINPRPGQENPMRQVVQLHAKVIQTRQVAVGDGIGYAHKSVAERPMRLATISLGYADGWHRRASSAAWVDGCRLPFVGRVSMDSIILDISALPPARLHAGDLVELIGPHQSVDDIAAAADTIGYEILTSLGDRFHRRYEDGRENAMPAATGPEKPE